MYRKTVEELQKDQREKLVIDIRSEQDYIKETYPGAKHIFWEEFMEHIGEIPTFLSPEVHKRSMSPTYPP